MPKDGHSSAPGSGGVRGHWCPPWEEGQQNVVALVHAGGEDLRGDEWETDAQNAQGARAVAQERRSQPWLL